MKKYSLSISVVAVIFVVMFLVGCGATASNSKKWQATDVNRGLKGQTESQIIERFGPPDRRYNDSKNTVFEYKKPTEGQNSGINTLVKVTTFGLYQTDSFVDMMRIKFRNGRVEDYSYNENVVGFASVAEGGSL